MKYASMAVPLMCAVVLLSGFLDEQESYKTMSSMVEPVTFDIEEVGPDIIDLPKKSQVKKQQSLTEEMPEYYGANGFDTKNDTVALQQALNAGKHVVLQGGATYIIDRPLVSNHTLAIETEPGAQQAAVILQKSEQSAFVFENPLRRSTHVVEDIKDGQDHLVLEQTEGIRAGDLLHLQSSKLWHWEDRGYLKKGGLYRVERVEGSVVYLDHPLSEAYSLGEETLTVNTYGERRLIMRNLKFKHSQPLDTVMVRINFSSNTQLHNVSVINSKLVGIFLNKTFGSTVRNVYASLGTTEEVQTGYGVQDYGGSSNKVLDSTFIRVRRGVDFSGDTPSRYGTVTGSRAYRPDGTKLAEGNSGFGTHSTAEDIVFQNNMVQGFDQGFVSRGNRITVQQNLLRGGSKRFLTASYGDNIQVLENIYKGEKPLEAFVLLYNTYEGKASVIGNKASGMKGSFVQGAARSIVEEGNRTME